MTKLDIEGDMVKLHWILGIVLIKLTKTRYLSLQSKHINDITNSYRCSAHMSILKSSTCLSCTSSCARAFPTVGPPEISPLLYLLCVLWQNRGKWLRRWRAPWDLQLHTNKELHICRACSDNAGGLMQTECENVWWNQRQEVHPLWGSKWAYSLLSVDSVGWTVTHQQSSRWKQCKSCLESVSTLCPTVLCKTL